MTLNDLPGVSEQWREFVILLETPSQIARAADSPDSRYTRPPTATFWARRTRGSPTVEVMLNIGNVVTMIDMGVVVKATNDAARWSPMRALYELARIARTR